MSQLKKISAFTFWFSCLFVLMTTLSPAEVSPVLQLSSTQNALASIRNIHLIQQRILLTSNEDHILGIDPSLSENAPVDYGEGVILAATSKSAILRKGKVAYDPQAPHSYSMIWWNGSHLVEQALEELLDMNFFSVRVIEDQLYFSNYKEGVGYLWVCDGTPSSLRLLQTFQNVENFYMWGSTVGDNILFNYRDYPENSAYYLVNIHELVPHIIAISDEERIVNTNEGILILPQYGSRVRKILADGTSINLPIPSNYIVNSSFPFYKELNYEHYWVVDHLTSRVATVSSNNEFIELSKIDDQFNYDFSFVGQFLDEKPYALINKANQLYYANSEMADAINLSNQLGLEQPSTLKANAEGLFFSDQRQDRTDLWFFELSTQEAVLLNSFDHPGRKIHFIYQASNQRDLFTVEGEDPAEIWEVNPSNRDAKLLFRSDLSGSKIKRMALSRDSDLHFIEEPSNFEADLWDNFAAGVLWSIGANGPQPLFQIGDSNAFVWSPFQEGLVFSSYRADTGQELMYSKGGESFFLGDLLPGLLGSTPIAIFPDGDALLIQFRYPMNGYYYRRLTSDFQLSEPFHPGDEFQHEKTPEQRVATLAANTADTNALGQLGSKLIFYRYSQLADGEILYSFFNKEVGTEEEALFFSCKASCRLMENDFCLPQPFFLGKTGDGLLFQLSFPEGESTFYTDGTAEGTWIISDHQSAETRGKCVPLGTWEGQALIAQAGNQGQTIWTVSVDGRRIRTFAQLPYPILNQSLMSSGYELYTRVRDPESQQTFLYGIYPNLRKRGDLAPYGTVRQGSFALSAPLPETAQGSWSLLSGEGSLSDPSDPSAFFTGQPGSYELQWTLVWEDGETTTDRLQFEIKPPMDAVLDFQDDLCELNDLELRIDVPSARVQLVGLDSEESHRIDEHTIGIRRAFDGQTVRQLDYLLLDWSWGFETHHFELAPGYQGAELAGQARVEGKKAYLNAVTPCPGSIGTWSIVGNQSGSFSDIHDPHAVFSGSSTKTYELEWLIETTTIEAYQVSGRVRFRFETSRDF